MWGWDSPEQVLEWKGREWAGVSLSVGAQGSGLWVRLGHKAMCGAGARGGVWCCCLAPHVGDRDGA